MSVDLQKIGEQNLAQIQSQVQQKQQEAAQKAALQEQNRAGESDRDNQEEIKAKANELIYYSDLSEFVTYKFNGKVSLNSSYLGSNFDVVV